MKKTSKLSRLFKFFWLFDGPPNKIWDAKLNELMDSGKITKWSSYTITFNDKIEVWIENHPYASGAMVSPLSNIHCSKKTKIRLEDYVNKFLEEKLIERMKELK